MKALPWLLEPDPANPGVRYYALRDLLGQPADDPEVQQARAEIMQTGTAAAILAAQNPDGSWTPRDSGYQETQFQLILLAELGADPADARIRRAGEYALGHEIAANGGFAYTHPPVPSKVVHCHNSMMVCALLRLGFGEDPRLQRAIEWQARAVTGDLLTGKRYYKSAASGPAFECAVNAHQPCGWGATKALRALAAVPESRRSPVVQKAIQAGIDFLLAYDLSQANYPYTEKISGAWFKFGFPLSFWSDILETAEVLVSLGCGHDPHLEPALRLIAEKQDEHGRWALEHTMNGKMWVDIEQAGQPSKWVTLRALRVLKAAGILSPSQAPA